MDKYFNLTGLTSAPPTIRLVLSTPHLQAKNEKKEYKKFKVDSIFENISA